MTTAKDSFYYFAYGSHMNYKQMNARCPGSTFISRACLDGYRFVYDGYSEKRNGAVANIIESAEDVVWGGLFLIGKDNLAALNWHEGYPSSYDRKAVEVKDDEGKTFRAIVYFRSAQPPGAPSQEYRDCVVQGAKDCGLPDEYAREIAERR